MRKVLYRCCVLALIFLQIAGTTPHIDQRDPMITYQRGDEPMEQGALIGAALYIVSRILGYSFGHHPWAQSLRTHVPFMNYIIPQTAWGGWKEEILNILGYATLGAAVGSLGSGGILAQQFQIGLSDAISHEILSEIASDNPI